MKPPIFFPLTFFDTRSFFETQNGFNYEKFQYYEAKNNRRKIVITQLAYPYNLRLRIISETQNGYSTKSVGTARQKIVDGKS